MFNQIYLRNSFPTYRGEIALNTHCIAFQIDSRSLSINAFESESLLRGLKKSVIPIPFYPSIWFLWAHLLFIKSLRFVVAFFFVRCCFIVLEKPFTFLFFVLNPLYFKRDFGLPTASSFFSLRSRLSFFRCFDTFNLSTTRKQSENCFLICFPIVLLVLCRNLSNCTYFNALEITLLFYCSVSICGI